MVTDKVQKFGKAKVISSRNIPLLLERQKILSATGLATCIRSHRDIFREDMCDELVSWLNDFSESELFKTNAAVKDLFCRAFVKVGERTLGVSEIETNYSYKVGTLDSSLRIPKIPSGNKILMVIGITLPLNGSCVTNFVKNAIIISILQNFRRTLVTMDQTSIFGVFGYPSLERYSCIIT